MWQTQGHPPVWQSWWENTRLGEGANYGHTVVATSSGNKITLYETTEASLSPAISICSGTDVQITCRQSVFFMLLDLCQKSAKWSPNFPGVVGRQTAPSIHITAE